MQQRKEENQIFLPEEEQEIIPHQNSLMNQKSLPTIPVVSDYRIPSKRKSKSKPKGLLLTQAAEIKRLSQSLSQYKSKYHVLEQQKFNRQDSQLYIKELIDSDNSKKNEIQKLSLTIRSLISSCEAYRKQINSCTQKIDKLEETNNQLVKKNETLNKENEVIKQDYRNYKFQTTKELESANKELALNQSYMQSLQNNMEDLMKRVKQIPDYQRQALNLQREHAFWREQTERLSGQLKTMNELYLSSQKKYKELEEKFKNLENFYFNNEQEFKKTQNKVAQVQKEKSGLKQKIKEHEVVLNQKNQEHEVLLRQTVENHKSKTDEMTNLLLQKQNEIKQKTKLIISLEKQLTKLGQQKAGEQEDLQKRYKSQINRLSTQKDSEVSVLNQLLQERQQKEKKLKQLLEQRERESMSSKKKIEDLEKEMIQISSELNFCESDKKLILKQLNKYKDKDAASEENLKKISNELKSKTIQVQNNNIKINELQQKLQQEIAKSHQAYNNIQQLTKESLKKGEDFRMEKLKTQSLQEKIANLTTKLNSEGEQNKQIKLRAIQKEKQLDNKNKVVENELKSAFEQNERLKKQIQELSIMVANKVTEGELAKQKMLNVENQLIQQFQTNLRESTKTYQNNLNKLQQQKKALKAKIQEQAAAQKKIHQYLNEKDSSSEEISLRAPGRDLPQIVGEGQSSSHHEIAKKIEQKLHQLRQMKRQYKKLNQSLAEIARENSKLKEEIKIRESQFSVRETHSKSLSDQNSKLAQDRIFLSNELQNKKIECQQLKRKLLFLEDDIRDTFQRSLRSQANVHKQQLQRVVKQKEEVKQEVQKIRTSQKQYEESLQIFNAANKTLEERAKIAQINCQKWNKQNEALKNSLTQFNKNYESAVANLLGELDRLQNIIISSQEKQKADLQECTTKHNELLSQVRSLEEKKIKHEIIYEQLVKSSELLQKRNESYEDVLSKLQNEFIALQLLIGELKQERNLILKKNTFMIKGIRTSAEQLQRLNESAQKISKTFEPQSPLHEDISKHYETIHQAFSSLDKFKVTVENSKQTPTETIEIKQAVAYKIQ